MAQCAKAVIYHLMHYGPDLCSWRYVFKCPKEDPHAVQVAMKCWPPIGSKPGDSKSARFTRYQFLAVELEATENGKHGSDVYGILSVLIFWTVVAGYD
jgi:hypothetical protein